jgi:hypothetical protein
VDINYRRQISPHYIYTLHAETTVIIDKSHPLLIMLSNR